MVNPNKDKLDKFVDAYVLHWNASKAAAEAGYSKRTCGAQACRLLKKVKTQEKIKEKVSKLAQDVNITQQWVLKRYKKLSTSDVHDFIEQNDHSSFTVKMIKDISPEDRACIKKIKNGPFGVELELHDKFAAMQDLARFTKMLDGENQKEAERDIIINIDYKGITKESLEKYGNAKGSKESSSYSKPSSE